MPNVFPSFKLSPTPRRLHCLHSISHFPGVPGLAGIRMSPFWILLELRVMEAAVTTGACMMCRAKVKMSPPTNQQPAFFTCRMPFLSPNQQCQSTVWRIWFLPSRRASRNAQLSFHCHHTRAWCMGYRWLTAPIRLSAVHCCGNWCSVALSRQQNSSSFCIHWRLANSLAVTVGSVDIEASSFTEWLRSVH